MVNAVRAGWKVEVGLSILPSRERPGPLRRRLTPQVATILRPIVLALFWMPAVVLCLSATLGASPQQPSEDPPVSLDRIRTKLAKAPQTRLKLDLPVQVPVATFKSRVDQRVYVPTLDEWIAKEFELNELQRQSADWSSKCCGIRLDPLLTSLDRALERRRVRKVRQQIARELTEIEAARKQASPDER